MTNPPDSYIVKFLRSEELTPDTFSFYFLKPSGFQFEPGQYNRWRINIENPDERGSSRPLTIATSPLSDYLIITTKKGETSFKKKLFSLKINEEISFFGPLGNFTLNEEDTRPKVFLAGGIGITSFYSMLNFVYQKKLKNNITLHASFSNKSETFYFDELTNISKVLPNIKIIYTLTKDPSTSSGQEGFENGRISEEMIKKYADSEESFFYVVGPSAMVEAMEGMLLLAGIPEERIKIENFTGY